MTKKRIVVTGMSIISCLGNDPDLFYSRLLQGESGISTITDFPCDEFPTKFAGWVKNFDPSDLIEKKLVRRIDRFISFSLWSGKKAILSAGIPLDKSFSFAPDRAGIIIGSGIGGMSTLFDNSKAFIEKGLRRVSPFLIPYIITNMGSALVAEEVGFMGPSYSVSTACATSNYAIALAAQHIERGDVDIMVAGGAEAAIVPIGLAGFCALHALSTRNDAPEKASRPWDKSRDGFVMAEGAGLLVLESLESAKRRNVPILAEYCGGAFTSDAYHMTDPRPDGLGVALCIQKALADASIKAEDISYINAHATSTLPGDSAEILALNKAFQHPEKIVMNATKSMVGHALGAAGGIEAIATIQAIRTGFVHPTINLEDPEPIAFQLPREKMKLPIDYALSNSFGFGGHNSCVIFSPYRE